MVDDIIKVYFLSNSVVIFFSSEFQPILVDEIEI
jgi:hypothetical protein